MVKAYFVEKLTSIQSQAYALWGLFFLTLVISLGFGSYLSRQKVTDPFLYYDMAFLKDQSGNDVLTFPEDGPFASLDLVRGRLILLRELSDVTGISPDALQYVPFGSMVVTALMFFLLYQLFRSPIVASLIALYLSLNLSHATAIYSVFAYALAVPIFLGAIFVYQRIQKGNGRVEIILLLLLFLAAQLIHYAIAVWIIFFLLGANLAVGYINKHSDPDKCRKLRSLTWLIVILILLFLILNHTLYTAYLPFIGRAALKTAWSNFNTYLASFWSGGDGSPYQMERTSEVAIVSAISLGIILLPILIGIIRDVYRRFQRTNQNDDYLLPIMSGVLVTGVLDVLVYLFRGSISTKFIALLFPFLSLFYLKRFGKQWLLWGFAASLLCLSLIKIDVFYRHSLVVGENRSYIPKEIVSDGVDWLDKNINKSKYSVLADLNLYGQYLLASEGAQSQPILIGMNADFYDQLVQVSSSGKNPTSDIIMIDRESVEPVMGFRWVRLAPMKQYLDQIWQNSSLNIIYDDGRAWFAVPINR